MFKESIPSLEADARAEVSTEDFVTLNILEYSVAKKSWSMIPGFSTFLIERDSFGSGTFRSAFRAKQFVVKRFRDSALGLVTEKGTLSVENALKKHIQMHVYARNYVKLLKSEAPSEYGEHFSMGKAYLATTSGRAIHYSWNR